MDFMKRLILLLFLFCSFSNFSFANERDSIESVKPTMNLEISRKVKYLQIDDIGFRDYNELFYDIKLVSKWNELTPIVKVVIKNNEGKTIWKKTFKNTYLYLFSNGQIQVGKPRFDQIIIYNKLNPSCYINTKEGLYK